MARISYVDKSQAPREVAELFDNMEARGAPPRNHWKIAAHSPATLPHLVRLGYAILSRTKLSPRLRELAILDVAEIMDCDYERRSHSMFAKEVGLTDRQIQSVKEWERSDAFDITERCVLRFVDEVTKAGRVKAGTFAALAEHLDEQMLVELAETAGYYGMMARILLPFEVDLTDEAPTSSVQIVGRRRQL